MNNAQASNEIQRIFESEIVPFCEQAFRTAVKRMQADLVKAGVVLTEELKNSIEGQKLSVSGNLEAEFRMAMKGYGRYKDMRQLTYDDFKPDPTGDFIKNIETWVQARGISTFKYVPGYFTDAKRRVVIPESRARNRIAWGIAMSIVKKGTVRRKARFWNTNRGKVYADVKRQIMNELPKKSLEQLVKYYESESLD